MIKFTNTTKSSFQHFFLFNLGYARPAIAFMIINAPDGFDAEVIANSELVMQEYQSFTDEFLEPFQKMKILEQSLVSKI